MARAKSRARQLAEQWEDRPLKDFDPEGEVPDADHEDGVSSDESLDEAIGTEHYLSVGKSKIRQKEHVALGAQYHGTRISRAALDQASESGSSSGEEDAEVTDASDSGQEEESGESEEYDDPDTADPQADQARVTEDLEIDSDEAFGESDEEKFRDFAFRGSQSKNATNGHRKNRPTAADFMVSDDDQDFSSDGGDGTGGELASFSEGSEDEGDSSSSENEVSTRPSSAPRTALSNIAASSHRDIEKGLAVRQQRKIFDRLLNVRIRLQKAMVAMNTLPVIGQNETNDGEEDAYRAAELAALKLLDTINHCRLHLLEPTGEAPKGKKRPLNVELTRSEKDIWDEMSATERRARKRRMTVLDRWDRKTSLTAKRKDILPIVSALEEQLQEPDRFVRRTRTPRSCAPAQLARKIDEDASIYDDADFYQRLLKDLVNQRTLDSSADPGSTTAAIRLAAANKEVKTRKQVDRRASKGRKMRFTVHEKLQNFMAPEDRRSWEQPSIDRFFGTLFGQKLALDEDNEEGEEAPADVEEQGLRLFRS